MAETALAVADGDDERRPDLYAIGLPATRDTSFSEEETITFLEKICEDWGEYEAGLAMGWSPAKIRRFLANSEHREIIWAIREADNESVERSIKATAKRGNPTAQKLWAYNKMSHRGWADRRSVRVEGEIDHNMVHSVKEALNEQTRALVEQHDVQGIAALQQAIGLGDPDEEDVIDAEVIDDVED